MITRTRPLFKVFVLAGFVTCVLLLYTYTTAPSTADFFSSRKRAPCPPEAYSDGKWVYDSMASNKSVETQDDVIPMAGFAGCASSREYYWHMAADNEKQWERFPKVTNWRWQPSSECSLREFSREALVRDLVEKGGWLILGDSISEGHFFSLSCTLYPHVVATPDYVKNPYFDRAWPQNLYLNPNSPLIKTLRFPRGFNISGTPLVTFRRVDLMLEQSALIELHRKAYNDPENFQLFSEEAAWSLNLDYYMDLFTAPLPEANYGTLVASTGGHWTTTLFSGYRDESKSSEGYGIAGVIEFFEIAMTKWATDVQRRLFAQDGFILPNGRHGQRQVVVRAYLPGHEDCHDHRDPWTEIQPMRWFWYNWGNIWQFNEVFQRVVSSVQYPNIHYLAIDRPARLRPDAHVSSDCLHIMTGAGVLEGWTHYIWHFVTQEVYSRIR
ncbi:hypothetical protein CPB85DRAFT_1377616 [Mucidula mucida]|nr:hypothetical protein CPB85DRAFT_1377616 [Mucidula mucida]